EVSEVSDMNYTVIRLANDGSAEWIDVDDQGGRQSDVRHGELGTAARQVGDRGTIVLVPSSDVLTVTTDLPLKGSKLTSALPYAAVHIAVQLSRKREIPSTALWIPWEDFSVRRCFVRLYQNKNYIHCSLDR
ncbi:MAG: hypothetical protein AAF391_04690, partial [Bacteroidota bacterium]